MAMATLSAGLKWTGAQISQSFCSVYYYGEQIAKSRVGQLFNDYVFTPVASRWPNCLSFSWNTMSNAGLFGSGVMTAAVAGRFFGHRQLTNQEILEKIKAAASSAETSAGLVSKSDKDAALTHFQTTQRASAAAIHYYTQLSNADIIVNKPSKEAFEITVDTEVTSGNNEDNKIKTEAFKIVNESLQSVIQAKKAFEAKNQGAPDATPSAAAAQE